MKKKHPRLRIRATFGEAAVIRDLVQRKVAQIGFLIDDDKLKDFEQKRYTVCAFSKHYKAKVSNKKSAQILT